MSPAAAAPVLPDAAGAAPATLQIRPSETQSQEPRTGEPQVPQAPLLRLAPGWGRLQQELGLPAWIDLDLQTVAEPMANPAGGQVAAGSWVQQTTLALRLRLPRAAASRGPATHVGKGPGDEDSAGEDSGDAEEDRWRLHLAIAGYNGDPLFAQRVGAALPLQEVANPVGLWLTRASLERRGSGGRWSLEAGVVGMAPDLFSAPIEAFYVHAALNSAPVLFPIPGFPVFPVAAPGAVLVVRPTPASSLRLASFDLAGSRSVADLLGTDSGLPAGQGWSHQLQWSYAPGWLNRRLEAPLPACRSGSAIRSAGAVCTDPVRVERQLPGGLLQLAGYAGSGPNRGLYGSATVPLALPWGLDHRIWAAAAAGLDDAANPTPSYLGGGLVSQGVLPGRPFDLLVLGAARTGFSPVLLPGLSREGVVELGYQVRVNRSFNLQPSLQWIVNPGGAGRVPGLFAVGLQLALRF